METIKRVKYRNCPLVEVVFQLNFPTILAIDASDPVKFQEEIRGEFPIYNVQIQQSSEMMINVDNSNPNPIFRHQMNRKNHIFASKDEKWRITLSNNMIAISTLEYTQWEDMKSRFEGPMNAFISAYKPAFFERIGMRYIDVIVKEKLGLQGKEWKELLKPHLCGIMGYSSPGLETISTSMVNADLLINGVNIHVECGLGTADQNDGKGPVEALILNCDYYMMGKFEEHQVRLDAEKVHERSHYFFRDSITEILHNAMEPVEIES